jgi:Winged helix DNA-binding domain
MVHAERFAAQLLCGPPARSVLDVADRLVAIQAQDPRGARLAVRARSAGLRAADVDHGLTAERSLVVTWLNRGTLHLVRSEDYWWLHGLMSPPVFTGNARRLAQEGVPPDSADRAVAVIERSLAADGPLTRGQLAERIAAAGVRTEGQAVVHILGLASLRGSMVRGPVTAGRASPEQAYVLVRDWLGPPPAPVDRDTALARLARRYLAGHGPATDRDLAKWSGLPLRDARRGFAEIGAELDQTDGPARLASLTRRGGPSGRDCAERAALPPPRLLGAFDPLLLGWASREPYVGTHQGIVTVNGLFRPFALIRGCAAATWTIAQGEVRLNPFTSLTGADEAALDREAADVKRFLGIAG